MNGREPRRATTWSILRERYLGWALLGGLFTAATLPWFLDGHEILLGTLVGVEVVWAIMAVRVSARLAANDRRARRDD